MRVAVVILNWNGLVHLKTYLPSVIDHSEDSDIYVIDNGSKDDSCLWIRKTYSNVSVIELKENLGFAKGYNVGLESIIADRYILLNSDVRVSPGWITSVNTSMAQHNWSVCSPLIINDKNPNIYEYAGAAGGFIDKDGFTFCAGRIFDTFEDADETYRFDREVFWASGAAFFIDSTAWKEVGGLDADLFAHMEEIDLCWRLKNRGHKIGVCGSASVRHLGGGTLSSSHPLKVYLNFRNNLLILLKNKAGLWPWFIFRRLVLDGIAAIRFLVKLEFKFFLSVARAHYRFYSMILPTIKKRNHEILVRESSKVACNKVGYYKKSILIQYFFRGKSSIKDLDASDFK